MIPHVVIDVGNTRIKWGLCTGGTVTAVASLAPDQPAAWEQQIRRWGLGPVVWMLTGVHPERRDRLADWLRKRGDSVHVLDDPHQLPLRVLLEHPERAGIDRLLDAVAVNTRRSGDSSAIIVDAGSAVTVDLVDETGAFRGGAIMPGLRLMAESLHRYTAKLPLIEIPRTTPAVPGMSTSAAMEAGIYWAFVGGVRALVEQYVAGRTVSSDVFLTGGDAALLHQHLSGSTFWPEMTLEGIRITAEALL
jgi:type III pantothenate kinase